MTSSSRLKATQAPQAQSHHRLPVAPMIHSTRAASGKPMAAPTSAPLSRSTTKSLGVMRLKPNCCSMRKVLYTSKGRSSAALTTLKATSKAS